MVRPAFARNTPVMTKTPFTDANMKTPRYLIILALAGLALGMSSCATESNTALVTYSGPRPSYSDGTMHETPYTRDHRASPFIPAPF